MHEIWGICTSCLRGMWLLQGLEPWQEWIHSIDDLHLLMEYPPSMIFQGKKLNSTVALLGGYEYNPL